MGRRWPCESAHLTGSSAWSTPRDPVPHLLPVLRPLLQSTQTHRPSQVKNSSPVRQTYGLYGIVVILRMLGICLEPHRTHNLGGCWLWWDLCLVGSRAPRDSCLACVVQNTIRIADVTIWLYFFFDELFVGRGAGASGPPNPYRTLMEAGP